MKKPSDSRGAAVIPGAETFYLPAGPVGCLLFHGISSTPQQMRQMGEYLAGEGISALGVRLKGHGTRVSDMHSCTYTDWIGSAEEGMLRLKEHCSAVFCAGLSMGGVISLRMARLYPEEIKGVITICSPYKLDSFLMRLIPFVKILLKKVPTGAPSVNDPDAAELKYGHHSLPAAHQLIKLTAVVRNDLPHIKQPALIIAADQDSVVSVSDGEHFYEELGSGQKEFFRVKNSNHVAVLDYDKDLIFQKTAGFIKQYSL